MSASRPFRDRVDPIPKEILATREGHDQHLLASEIRALARMRDHQRTMAERVGPPPISGRPKPARPSISTGSVSSTRMSVRRPSLKAVASALIAAGNAVPDERQTGAPPVEALRKAEDSSESPSARIAAHYSPLLNNVDVVAPKRVAKGEQYATDGARAAKKFTNIVAPKLGLKHTSFLPLEMFDDNELELSEDLSRWVGCRGRSIFFESAEYSWKACTCIKFDTHEGLFIIQWDDDKAKARLKTVTRLNIQFDAEDAATFLCRRSAALERRTAAEALARLYLYVNEMPATEVDHLDETTIDAVLNLVAAEFPMNLVPFIEQFIEDMRENYEFSCKLGVFYYRFMAVSERERLEQLELPEPEPLLCPPAHGTLEIPEHMVSFRDARSFLTSNLFSVHPRLVAPLRGIYERWLDSFSTCFLLDTEVFTLRKPCTIQEFVDHQTAFRTAALAKLRDDWVPNTAWMIQNDLEHLEGFQFYEDDMERHLASPLRNFLQFVNLLMSQQLRQLTEASLCRFVEFLETKDGTSSDPLFTIRFFIQDVSLVFDPSLSTVVQQCLALFDQTVADALKLPKLGANCLPLLDFPGERPLQGLEPTDPFVATLRARLEAAVTSRFEDLSRFSDSVVGRYSFLWTLSIEEVIEDQATSMEEKVGRYRRAAFEVRHELRRTERFMDFLVDCTELRRFLRYRADLFLSTLLKSVIVQVRRICDLVCRDYQEINERLSVKPSNAEELAELQEYYKSCLPKFQVLESEIGRCRSISEMLEGFCVSLPVEEFEQMWRTVAWPAECMDRMDLTKMEMEEDRRRFMESLRDDLDKFIFYLDNLLDRVQQLSSFGDLAIVEEVFEKVEGIGAEIQQARERARLYNSREKFFEWQETSYPQLQDLQKAYEPYRDLWTVAAQWTRSIPEWMEGQFTLLDPEKMEADVGQWWRILFKLSKAFSEKAPNPAKISAEVKEKVEDFKNYLPLVTALRNPGLRDRHWEKISEVCGIPLYPSDDMTLKGLLQMDVLPHIEKIQEISEVASKEYKLERALDKMQAEWKPMAFDCAPWRNTGTHILRGIDDVQNLLDDHIVKTQSMRGDPNIKAIEKRCKDWEEKLRLTQDILDEWLKCQGVWLYLEPIFASDDIVRQLPVEAKRFEKVDGVWKKTMETTVRTPGVLTATSIENLLPTFIEANRLLDMIQKGLNDYLETKRLAFPRFFFLSNDELLEILSETKDPLRVQPHLRKCFENVDKLEFQKNLDITAMFSVENERVGFMKKMNPADSGNQVEKWLLEVERSMVSSLKDSTTRCAQAKSSSPYDQWVVNWPGQVIIAVSSLIWTKGVEDALQGGGLKGLTKFDKTMNQLMDTLVTLVRGDLSSLARATLGALVVIEVHNRDVVTQMVKDKVSDATSFDWLAQLRYYLVDDGSLVVRQTNASLAYGYEYLGNSARLVITPLTDRCYRTLMGALHLYLGGAPEGPAGTGKTETTKDLAKAVAKQCVVFNCSDGLDYLAMGKFFKGLASSGAWSCFDEFNRIDLEVLSVIAQQILTIQRAIAANMSRFVFEGTELALNKSCAVFITMNPGYAGRSELPDNLKALFRPVAMMVPNYALIAEISLFSYGFLRGRPLSEKIVATYKLCSEQLSSQDHYDYGMRAVKAVLTAAGNLKRKYPDENEDIIVLRAIQDVNLPKFLSHDIPLFNGITSDLFPGVSLPEIDRVALTNAMTDSCVERNLQATAPFLEKVIQLYEMVIVRHGLMVVGLSFAGKTCAIRVLADSLTKLNKVGLEKVTHLRTLNPKSITMGQLYGSFDPVSHEWSDGILANIFRECSSDTAPDRKWIIFDGPVDALWIESMNTVLDDNKKLCLVSGEIIQMSNSMNLIFEVQDLAVASPATVSRCGMVYMEPESLGWRPLVKSWLAALRHVAAPAAGAADDSARGQSKSGDAWKLSIAYDQLVSAISDLFELFVPNALAFRRKKCREYVALSEIMLVASVLRLYDSLLFDVLRPTGGKAEEGGKGGGVGAVLTQSLDSRSLTVVLEAFFVFSLVWCFGGSVDQPSRQSFENFMRESLSSSGKQLSMPPIPDKGSVFDFCFDRQSLRWVGWMETTTIEPIPKEASFSSIIVTTIDSIRYSYLLETLALQGKPVLFVGPTGTGKTVYIKNKLNSLAGTESGSDNKFVPIFVNFSAQTSANQTQDLIDAKLDKRRKGVYGPPLGKRALIFVDDLNMPMLERYGAQPPIELLRQWMDHSGWYDRKEKSFRNIVDVQFIAAMGPPGGGRNHITPRFARHFNVFALNEFEDESMSRIFGTIMDWFLDHPAFSMSVKGLRNSIVNGTVAIYRAICKELLPTPSRPHYIFNLRDLSKVFQGISMIRPEKVEDSNAMLRLWYHECQRVFQDRLIDDPDRQWFDSQVDKVLKDLFKLNGGLDQVFVGGKRYPLLFADFRETDPDNRKYEEIIDVEGLQKIMTEYLDDFNAMSNKRMNLVLFRFAISHVARISRILRQPRGHSLLIGVGGSGRQSLTRLASFIAEMDVVQVEMSKNYTPVEWREDLKALLRRAGLQGKETVFLFTDTQIKYESFLEDISNLLNTGEVPNLFPADELTTIVEGLKTTARDNGVKDLSRNGLYGFFVDRCRDKLHLVLAMSPVGDALRNRLRQFPALVNCCTIDWFTQWPQDALRSVASTFLGGIDVEIEPPSVRTAVCEMCVLMHESVHELSTQYRQEAKRFNYVTPTSYLELISTFKTLLTKSQKSVHEQKRRYEIGLQKLSSAEGQVASMQTELTALKPVLIQTTKETEDLIKVIERESKDAAETKKYVEVEEAEANKKAAEAKKLKDECEADLAEAIPALDAATKALKSLTKKDITEVKAMTNPPAGVRLVMEAVCIMKEVKPVKKDAGLGKKIDDYWDPAKKMMAQATFLQSLLDFDKDHIPETVIQNLQPYMRDPDFVPEVIERVSIAAKGLCSWVRAMDTYHRIARVVAPKRAALAKAEGELNQTMALLREKKATLQGVVDRIDGLNSKYEESRKKKEDLASAVQDVEAKLDRAQRLIGGLGGEKTRWTASVDELARRFANLTGDVLIASGVIAYLGAFTTVYRRRVVNYWLKKCVEEKIPCGDSFSLAAVLGEPVKIREWNICGLPADSFSVDNGIIVANSRRWPLLIDPQGQANRWIKNLEKDNKLMVMKLTDEGFLRSLENAIQFGTPVLLENVGEELDPVLEPLLLKQTFKQSGSLCIKLGDNTIEYSKDFRLYITTKLRNPHYLPEVSTKVSLINFMITPEGLEDQLLGIVVAKEKPDLEKEKNELVIQSAENKRLLKEIEDKILELLSSSQGNILEDEAVVNALSKSKVTANEIAEKQASAEITEAEIDSARLGYRPVSIRGSVLFFCISELANIDPMYQYSLNWFLNLFIRSIQDSPQRDKLEDRLGVLQDYFTESLYRNICRSLFEKDKLLFSFLLCVKIEERENKLVPDEWRFLLTGGLGGADSSGDAMKNPASGWLMDKSWSEILRLGNLGTMRGFSQFFVEQTAFFQKMYDSSDPQKAVEVLRALSKPGTAPAADAGAAMRFNAASLTDMQFLLVLRCVRADKLVPAIQDYVEKHMDKRFIDPPVFDLGGSFADSDSCTPLVFVLSPGADPMTALIKFAESRGFGKKMEALSLGQGQGPIAERKIKEACQRGTWVVLQNCHLAVSWLASLEKIVEELTPESIHPEFRLWLTSMPSDRFPVSVLQNSVKMTNEPPKGLRANLMRSFMSDPIVDEQFFGGSSKDLEFKRLLFSLCFFHAVVQERRKFGPLGWNIPYEFTESDLRISVRQLQMFLNEYEEIPFPALLYLTGEANYGGRVTDDNDRRCLMTLLSDFYNEDVLEVGHPLSRSGVYKIPGATMHKDFLEYIKSLPLGQKPEVFGLHENADITKDLQETQTVLDSILVTAPSVSTRSGGSEAAGSGAGKKDGPGAAAGKKGGPAADAGGSPSSETGSPAAASVAPAADGLSSMETATLAPSTSTRESVVSDMARDILSRLPPLFDVEAAATKYPVSYNESMNTVLVQELIRFNKLISVIQRSLSDIQKAVKGLVVMSSELDMLATNMYSGKLPAMWASKSYPSMKPLASYVADLIVRLRFFQDWIDNGPPVVFLFSAFFFTQSFLTGVLQNYARKYVIPIDTCDFDVEILKEHATLQDQPPSKPEDGCYINGLFLEGCRWDKKGQKLAESLPKVLFTPFPTIWLKPGKRADIPERPSYRSPVYKTLDRRGVLSTTGHSSNLVCYFRLPTDQDPGVWVRRGVALFCSLND